MKKLLAALLGLCLAVGMFAQAPVTGQVTVSQVANASAVPPIYQDAALTPDAATGLWGFDASNNVGIYNIGAGLNVTGNSSPRTINATLSNASLSVTYTGTPVVPIQALFYPQRAVIPVSAGTGSPITVSQQTTAGFMASVYYGENGIVGTNNLLSISFNDAVSWEQLYFQSCPLLTSLALSVATNASGIYLSTLPALTTISMPDLVSVIMSQNNALQAYPFVVGTCNALVTLSLPSLKYVSDGGTGGTGMSISSNSSLATINLPALVVCDGGFGPSTLPALTTLTLTSLTTVNGNFSTGALATLPTLSCPALSLVGGNFAPTTMADVTTWIFTALATVGGNFAPTTMGALTDLECNALQTVGGAFSITSMASLTTASFSGMVTYGSTITMNSGLGNLTSVTLGTNGTLKAITGATINISGQKLTSASVNAILSLLVSLDGTNGTTLWGSGKTLTINGGTNGAPTGQGITDKATLIGRGATVTTN